MLTIFGEKMAFFLKTNFEKTKSDLNKNSHFSQLLGENISKIITSVPAQHLPIERKKICFSTFRMVSE
jgi:hypothetical protein